MCPGHVGQRLAEQVRWRWTSLCAGGAEGLSVVHVRFGGFKAQVCAGIGSALHC